MDPGNRQVAVLRLPSRHPRGRSIRLLELRSGKITLATYLRSNCARPCDRPSSPWFAPCGTLTVTKTNPNSAPLLLPNVRWDYIFARWPSGRRGGVGHPLCAEVVGTTAKKGIVPSDHHAVLADLRY